VYTTFGGMRAVIWTDIMQLIVLFSGQLAIALIAISRVPGGLKQVIDLGREGGRLDLSLSADPTVRVTLWGLLIGAAFMSLVQMATDQVSVQRYLTARMPPNVVYTVVSTPVTRMVNHNGSPVACSSARAGA
jgi:sodium-coupled monocarboxylate transporter 8/12